jgi:GST-like protein
LIDLHFVATPNGHKVSIMMAETGLPHRVVPYNLLKGEHLSDAVGAINPNRRLPAIVDHDSIGGGEPLALFESGAILIYLAEKTGRFLPADPRGRHTAIQWLMWQMSGLGPQHGQAHHFLRYAPDPPEYAVQRYSREARRLFDVLELRLSEVDYLAGEYSIADMACWPWVRACRAIDMDVRDWPAITAWYRRIAARPAVQAGAAVPENDPAAGRHMKLNDEQWSALFGEKMLNAVRK